MGKKLKPVKAIKAWAILNQVSMRLEPWTYVEFVAAKSAAQYCSFPAKAVRVEIRPIKPKRTGR